jgi:prepilin-type N-terminal cleavage/methylation domain-containing protein
MVKKFPQRSKPNGFTLIEVLVSTAILAGIVILLAVVLQEVQLTSYRGSVQVELAQRGRALLDIIGRETGGALISPQLQFVINPPLPAEASAAPGADSVFFQALSANGTPAIIGYYLGVDRTLRRVFISSESPLFTVHNQAPSKAVPWLQNPDLFDLSNSDGRCVIIAEGVAGFWLRAMSINGEILPGEGAARVTDENWGDPLKFDSSYKVVANRLPSRLEVALMLVDSRSRVRVEARGFSFPDIPGTTSFEESTYLESMNKVEELLLEAGADGVVTFIRAVNVRGGSL